MIKLNVIDRAAAPQLYYTGGDPLLLLDDGVRCERTEKGLRLVESHRVHDFNKQGEYIGSESRK